MADEAAQTRLKRLFEHDEYIEKIRSTLEHLKKLPPMSAKRLATKSELLIESRPLLQGLVDDGYSIEQIAAALNHDIFKILPKAIKDVLKQGDLKGMAIPAAVSLRKPGRPRGPKKSAVAKGEGDSKQLEPAVPGRFEARGDRADSEL